jgi:hypothetical protein
VHSAHLHPLAPQMEVANIVLVERKNGDGRTPTATAYGPLKMVSDRIWHYGFRAASSSPAAPAGGGRGRRALARALQHRSSSPTFAQQEQQQQQEEEEQQQQQQQQQAALPH